MKVMISASRKRSAGWLVSGVMLCLALTVSLTNGAKAQAGTTPASPNISCPSGQCFTDVPPSNPFFAYVNNLYLDSIISGYACGGTGEPCDSDNRPYYRPNNNVTRQQMSKFVDNGRRLVTGAWTGGSGPDYGIFSAINTDTSNENNAGVYGSSSTGVWGESRATGASRGFGGYFRNLSESSTGAQFGVFASTGVGIGVYGESTNGAGAVFQGITGVAVSGYGGSSPVPSDDGLDVSSGGGAFYAIYSSQPAGDLDFTLYGAAHIHGSNIAAGEYEQEAVYNGPAPLPLGRVVSLDPENIEGGPLGVVPAGMDNADAAIGVVSYRLDTAQVNGVDKTYIDAAATEVQHGDRVYISFAGRVKMKLAGQAKVGARLSVGPEGTAMIAPSGDNTETFGKVASRPAADGTVNVIVNFK